jgi:hypothetical protein
MMLLRYTNAVTRQEEYVPMERVIRIRDYNGGSIIDVDAGGRPLAVEVVESAAKLIESLAEARQ